MSMTVSTLKPTAEWRDVGTSQGQAYWAHLCKQEARIRAAWLIEEHARALARSSFSPGPVELLGTSIGRRDGLWRTCTMPGPHVPHRMGADRGFTPLSAYERSLRDGARTAGPGEKMLMSTMPRTGDAARLSLHSAQTEDELRAHERLLLPAFPSDTVSAGQSADGDGKSEYDRSRALGRSRVQSGAQAGRLTAEQRRQQLLEGAAGKPRYRDMFAGPRLPPPLELSGRRPATGLYRPTEADIAKMKARQLREARRLHAQAEKAASKLVSDAR